MNKRSHKGERRAALRAAADEAQRAQALATPRHLDADLHFRGVGQLLFRLASKPSFEPALVWEILSVDGRLAAFKSLGVEPGSPMVTGHDEIEIDDETLRRALDELSLVSLPLTPAVASFGVLDGERFFATVAVGYSTRIRLSWCADHEPIGWSTTVRALLRVRDLLQHPPSATEQAGDG